MLQISDFLQGLVDFKFNSWELDGVFFLSSFEFNGLLLGCAGQREAHCDIDIDFVWKHGDVVARVRVLVDIGFESCLEGEVEFIVGQASGVEGFPSKSFLVDTFADDVGHGL